MSNDYGKQVADLIEAAFKNLAAGGKASPASPADLQLGHAQAQLHAAQTIATLGLATEVRAVGLMLAAGSDVGADRGLIREAFTAGAIMLGLVEADPEEERDLGALREALTGDPTPADADPADKDVEL